MYARENRSMCQKTQHVHVHSDVCVIKKKRMRDESDDLVTGNEYQLKHQDETHVCVGTKRTYTFELGYSTNVQKIANTSKVSRMRLETQLVPREANVYVTIKQSNDSKK